MRTHATEQARRFRRRLRLPLEHCGVLASAWLCLEIDPIEVPRSRVHSRSGTTLLPFWRTVALLAEVGEFARGCYEVCTKIGAYVGGPSYPLWMDGKPGESRLSERRFG